jgi:hypothetical protein
VGEEPDHTIARKRKPGPLNPPKLLSKINQNFYKKIRQTLHMLRYADFLIT